MFLQARLSLYPETDFLYRSLIGKGFFFPQIKIRFGEVRAITVSCHTYMSWDKHGRIG